jgi:hypothetical protein
MNILEVYNPANADKLTAEQEAAMKDLSNEQIAQLAENFPNQPSGNAYLKYYITSEDAKAQRFPLGTWKNLHELRKLGRNDVLPFAFNKKLATNLKLVTPVAKTSAERTVDLSAAEAAIAEGVKVATAASAAETLTGAVAAEAAIAEGESEEVISLKKEITSLEGELKQAVEKKEHPQKIKKLEKDIEALKLKLPKA